MSLENVIRDTIASGLRDELPSNAALKKKAIDLVKGWLAGEEPALAALLGGVLADGRLDKDDAIALVSAIVSRWGARSPFAEGFTKSLIAALGDNELSLKEVAGAALGWVSGRMSNANTRQFIAEIADGSLSLDGIQSLLLKFVEHKRGRPASDALGGLLQGKVLLSEVLMLFAALRMSTNPADPGSTLQAHHRTLEAFLQGDTDAALDTAIDKLVQEDYPGVASVLLGTVLKGDDIGVLLQQELAGRLKTKLEKELLRQVKKHVVGITDAEADKLVDAVSALLSGERELFAKQTDMEEFENAGFAAEKYPVWKRVRLVLYAAMQATSGGSIVPTDALARPHVFAMAAIKPGTALKALVADNQQQRELFAESIKRFCAVEFADGPGAKILRNPLNYPMTPTRMAAGGTAGYVLEYVYVAMTSGDA